MHAQPAGSLRQDPQDRQHERAGGAGDAATLQNILHRAAEAAGLLVVLPRGRRHLFPLARPFQPAMAETYGGKVAPVPSPRQVRFDVFAAHSLWDGAMVARLVPAAFTLTILRYGPPAGQLQPA